MKYIFGISFYLISLLVTGQSLGTQYNLTNSFTFQRFNPAFQGDSGRITMAPPLIGQFASYEWRNSPAFRGILLTNPNHAKDLDEFVNALEESNFTRYSYYVQDFYIGMGYGKNYFSFNVAEIAIVDFTFPRDAAVVLQAVENQRVINLNLEVLNLSLELTQYREFGFTWSRRFGKRWNVGVGLNYYYGVANVHTIEARALLFTQLKPDGSGTFIKATGEYDLRTSGLGLYDGRLPLSTMFAGSGNWGFGIDIGAEFVLNEHWSFSVSATDLLNKFYWRNNINSQKSEYVDLNIVPANILEMFQTDPLGFIEALPGAIDSLEQMLIPRKNSDSYTSQIPTRIFLNAAYNWNQYWRSYGYAQITLAHSHEELFVRLGVQRNIGKHFNVQSNFGIAGEQQSVINMGLGVEYFTKHMKAFVLTENIMALTWKQRNLNPSFIIGFEFSVAMKTR